MALLACSVAPISAIMYAHLVEHGYCLTQDINSSHRHIIMRFWTQDEILCWVGGGGLKPPLS